MDTEATAALVLRALEDTKNKNAAPDPDDITDQEIAERKKRYQLCMPDFPELPAGFFKDYMDFGIRMSYAIPEYHFASILAVLSNVIGRKVMMQSTNQTVYCNVNVCLIGETTISGKSTACDLAVNNFFGLVHQEGLIEMLPKKNSPQSVIQRLAKVPNRLWYYDECSEFFEDAGSQWGSTLESILCSLYDGRPVSYGLSEGKGKVDEYKVENVFLSCLWNTTTSEIERHANYRSFSNGFYPRIMWFWNFKQNIPRKNRAMDEDDWKARTDIETKIQRLRSILMRVSDNMIVFQPSDVIEDWKINSDLSHLEKEHEKYRVATGRLFGHAYKLSMMFSLMDADLQSVIDGGVFPKYLKIPDDHAKMAVKICDEYLRSRILYLADLCESNQTKSGQDIIIKTLKKHDGVATKSELLCGTRIKSKVMDELLGTLEEAGRVRIDTKHESTKPVMVVSLSS